MISILRATEKDCNIIVETGKVSVAASHKDSSSAEIMDEFLETYYNHDVIAKELANPNNIYHIIKYNNQAAGFSKIEFNAPHKSIIAENVAKLDRIYLLEEFHGLKLGLELLKFNIDLCTQNNQSGIWLYSWVGNKRAIDFYSRAGFKIIGNYDYHVAKDHYDPSYLMFLDLNAGQTVSTV